MNDHHRHYYPRRYAFVRDNLTPKIKPRTNIRDDNVIISTKINDTLHVYECDILEEGPPSSSSSILSVIEKQLKEPSIPLEVLSSPSSLTSKTDSTTNQQSNGGGKKNIENGNDDVNADDDKNNELFREHRRQMGERAIRDN